VPAAGDRHPGAQLPAHRAATDALRLFIGLWPDAAALEALLAWRSTWQWPAGAKLVPPDRIHLTLHFLGSVPRLRVDGLRTALAAPRRLLAPIELRFGQGSVWPRGLAVLAPDPACSGLPALQALHAEIGVVLQGLGFRLEARRFRPHVTLARDATGAEPPPVDAAFAWPVRGYVLVQSESGYRVLQHCP
jgi:2'-5' RNA ligase